MGGFRSFNPDTRKVVFDNQGATAKNVLSTSDDGNQKTASSRKSLVKNVAIDKEGTTKTKSSDTCVKVNNNFRVLSNENHIRDKDRVIIEEREEDSEEFYGVDSEKYAHYVAYEDKANKEKKKELSRL